MSSEVLAALAGAGVGGVIAWVLQWLQNREAEKDWHRNNQRDIDWRAEDFVIEVQAFSNNPEVMAEVQFMDNRQLLPRFNGEKAILLIAKANAFEARVMDPELKGHIQELNSELLVASHRGEFDLQRKGTIHYHCQKFYYRIAEMYGTGKRKPALDKAEEPKPAVVRVTTTMVGPAKAAEQSEDVTPSNAPDLYGDQIKQT